MELSGIRLGTIRSGNPLVSDPAGPKAGSREIVTVNESSSIKEAASKMLSHNVGCLIVNDKAGKFAGLVTERDIAHAVAGSPDKLASTTVAEIMTRAIVSCPPGTPTSQAREIMTTHQIRHLPIVDHGVVVGILSARDLMGRQLLEDRAAAEEVAMLSNCLKSIDLNEVADTITKEAPRLFAAGNCVLWCKEPELVSRKGCLCPSQQLSMPDTQHSILNQSIPEACEDLKAQPPRLVIPLTVSLPKDPALIVRTQETLPLLPVDVPDGGSTRPTYGGSISAGPDRMWYLCMCGLAPSIAANKELTSYKARLAREILTSHLTNATLYQHARITSLTDALTGVGSRKLLDDKLESECARAKRYKRPFSVAMVDLDNFKTINDVLSHDAGDEALRKLAACMKSQKRTPDILARYGGDEFVILMPETKAQDACVLLERLRREVQHISLPEELSMSISCGIAQYFTDPAILPDSTSDVIRRADLALYEAKSAGRNCVKVWNLAAHSGTYRSV